MKITRGWMGDRRVAVRGGSIVLLATLACALVLAAAGSPARAATLTVNSTGDTDADGCGDGECTLREAISAAAPGDTVSFDLPAGSTITLAGGTPVLAVDKDLRIEGPGANRLAVSAGDRGRVFKIGAGTSVTISGLTIRDGYDRGADYHPCGGGEIENCPVPAAPGEGGGVYNSGALDLSGVALVDNSATGGSGTTGSRGASGLGGGIYNAGTLNVSGSTFSGNAATAGSVCFRGACAAAEGGGIYSTGDVDVSNSTFDDNRATNPNSGGPGAGGGIMSGPGSSATAVGVTVTNNTATSSGGGLAISSSAASPATFRVGSSIVALNTASGTANGPDVSGAFASDGYNLIGVGEAANGFGAVGDQTGAAASPLDPKLGPLQDNGGPTGTRALLSGSPALDTGKSFGRGTDQRGEARPMDNPHLTNADGGDGSDIGAFELFVDTVPPTVVAVLSEQPNASGWHNADVSVTLEADDGEGSDVASITYKVNEDQPATVSGARATLDVTDEGATTISYHATDESGNRTGEQSVQLKLDKSAPTGSVSINNGAAKTRKLAVNLRLGADSAPSGVAEMCVSNTRACTAWEPFASTRAWKLSGKKAGAKTVYVTYRDAAGNVSTAAKDTIKYVR